MFTKQRAAYFILSLAIALVAPIRSLADSFQVKPVFEFDTNDRVKSIDSMKGNETVGSDGLFKQSAQGETAACNQAIQAIGTFTSQSIKATVCHASTGNAPEKCEQRIFRSAKIVGGSIARTTAGGTKPTLVSQVNELANPGQEKLKTCGSNVSWDPVNNRKTLGETAYLETKSGVQHFQAGDRNPLYKSADSAKIVN